MLLGTAFNLRHLHLFSIYAPSQACPVLWSLDAHLGLLIQTDAISRRKCFVFVPLADTHGCFKIQHVTSWKTLEHAGEVDLDVHSFSSTIRRASQMITVDTESIPWAHWLLCRLLECFPNLIHFQHTRMWCHFLDTFTKQPSVAIHYSTSWVAAAVTKLLMPC